MKHNWAVEDYEEYRRNLSRQAPKKRRENAKKAGMCSICCKNPARPNKSTCDECSMRAMRHYNKRMAEYRQKGMCLCCGERPPMIYHRYCLECMEKKRENNNGSE